MRQRGLKPSPPGADFAPGFDGDLSGAGHGRRTVLASVALRIPHALRNHYAIKFSRRAGFHRVRVRAAGRRLPLADDVFCLLESAHIAGVP